MGSAEYIAEHLAEILSDEGFEQICTMDLS